MLPALTQYSYISSNDFSADYELIHKIGEGSFSDVWLCIDQNNGKKLAAKILKKDFGKSVNAATLNEISEVKVARLVGNHPFLLMVEGVYHQQEYGKIVLFTELMKKSLYDMISEGECPFSAYTIKSYTYQMLEGLRYLHEKNFIHRDIKPENILLGWRDKMLKIGDFGTACHVSEGQPYTEYVATRWYRSPECLLTRGWYGKKMDIWAMGCVIYEMATGKPLFCGQDENEQMEQIDWVLGYPDYRLIEKFRKNKSDVFILRYETLKRPKANISVGMGLHIVYQPYQPAYTVLKEMIVYDPNKRYSADRLLRMSYFNDIKNSPVEYQLKAFAKLISCKRTKSISEGESTVSGIHIINHMCNITHAHIYIFVDKKD
uniref:MAPK/MAK/MRK overlapping kinase n=1 Tax=Sipha flava TaxID=143950 RepID=A0A2S2R103_9HEMI